MTATEGSWWIFKERLHLSFNPVVSTLSFLTITFVTLFSITFSVGTSNNVGYTEEWIYRLFTSLYVLPRTIAIFGLVTILFRSKWSSLKLSSEETEEPKHSMLAWFCMILMTGLGAEFVFHSVSYPIDHYTENNRYLKDYYMPDNTLAQNALNLVFYHWGFHMWSTFSMVGLTMAFIAHRRKLPISFKTCFNPFLGKATFTWIGDLLDSLAVCAACFSVIASLVYGTSSLNSNINLLILKISRKRGIEVLITWFLVISSGSLAACGIIFDMKYTFRIFSFVAVALSGSVCFLVWILDQPWFLTNIFVQSVGFYLSSFLQLSFHTDAFEQVVSSAGASTRGVAVDDRESDGDSDWMWKNTMMYWGMWMSWSPFVGAFLAEISRGRTVKEFIIGTLIVPVIVTFIWISIFGGGAIATERFAHSELYCCDENWDSTLLPFRLNSDTVLLSSTNGSEYCEDNTCNACSLSVITKYQQTGTAINDFRRNLQMTLDMGADGTRGDYHYVQNFMGPRYGHQDQDAVRLSCVPSEQRASYNVMRLYDIGVFLQFLLLCVAFMFSISTSAAALYVVSMFTNNGLKKFGYLRILIWAFVIGSCTTVVIRWPKDASQVMGSMRSILSLPLAVAFCAIMASLFKELSEVSPSEAEHNNNNIEPDKRWDPAFLEIFTTIQWKLIRDWLKNIVQGPSSISFAYHHEDKMFLPFISRFFLYFMLIFAACIPFATFEVSGIWALGVLSYLGFVLRLTWMRQEIRVRNNLKGDLVQDFLACFLSYPTVCQQVEALNPSEVLPPAVPPTQPVRQQGPSFLPADNAANQQRTTTAV